MAVRKVEEFLGALGGAAKGNYRWKFIYDLLYQYRLYKTKVAFAAPYPGKIIPMDLRNYGGRLICQKDAYLCSAMGVSVGIAFTKKLGAGILVAKVYTSKIRRRWNGFYKCRRYYSKEAMPGETIKIDTGCLVAMTQNVHYDIEFVGGIKIPYLVVKECSLPH